MRVVALKEIPDDPALAHAWNYLVSRMEHPEVFFTYQWSLAVSRAFQATLTPLLLLVYEVNELCGVAAFAQDKENQTRAYFLTASTADYCDVVSAPAARRAVLELVLQEIANLGVRELILANLPADSSTSKELRAASRARHFHFASRPAYECGLVEFGNENERKAMVRTVTHKSREQRGLKRLSSLGTVGVRHLVNLDEAIECLPQFFGAHVSRFLATGRISPLIRPERRLFLQELTTLLAEEGWLRISRLELNQDPVAWNYGFIFGGSWFWYMPSFKVEYEDCSPGSCLLRLLVEQGCADPALKELDLGLGDESYKNRFATSVRKTHHVHLSHTLNRHVLVVGGQFITTGAVRFPTAAGRLRQTREIARSLAARLRDQGMGATLAHVGRRTVRAGVSEEEILFFEAPETDESRITNLQIGPVTWENLAESAIANADDPDTLHYLLRSAVRLKQGNATGFLLQDQEKRAVHFLAVTDFNGFHIAEISHKLTSNNAEDAMIFDCWTPARFRGLGYYSAAIRQAATDLRNKGKKIWIFCGASNRPSVRGILKAGFAYRHSLVRTRRFGWSTVVRRDRSPAM